MERVNRILQHPLYRDYMEKNEMAEADRRFCHHDMRHFLDVARIAMILQSDEDFPADGVVPKTELYAAALLHDIGRFMQYSDGTPHEKASCMLAPEILISCGYDEKESARILEAIGNHRNAGIAEMQNFDGILYRADKLSRPCFACPMEPECNWKGEKKNLELKI